MSYRPERLKRFNCAGTVQDFAVSLLCNLTKPIMSVQNAASWGYFNTIKKEWNTEVLIVHTLTFIFVIPLDRTYVLELCFCFSSSLLVF